MAGKARVHELAKELGLSSKQTLSKLQDLGAYVRSPSSTVEAPVARQLRESVTGRGQAGQSRRAWPHTTGGNDPYSPPTRRPRSTPPHRRTPPGPTTPPRPPMAPRPRPDDDSFAADLARARAESAKPRPTGPRTPKMPPLAVVIAEHTGRGGFHDPLNADIATAWAMQWHGNVFEYDDAVLWMQAGLNGNEADTALRMCRTGWTPATLRRVVRGETVLALWRKGIFSIEDIDRMLREQDGDGAK